MQGRSTDMEKEAMGEQKINTPFSYPSESISPSTDGSNADNAGIEEVIYRKNSKYIKHFLGVY